METGSPVTCPVEFVVDWLGATLTKLLLAEPGPLTGLEGLAPEVLEGIGHDPVQVCMPVHLLVVQPDAARDLGLGEARPEIGQVMDDLRIAEVDFLTIGQYLQPTIKHAAVDRYVTPDEFEEYAIMARAKGFLQVSATPLTRSSYHADADFARLREARSLS